MINAVFLIVDFHKMVVDAAEMETKQKFELIDRARMMQCRTSMP